jgi:hypothetical protein
MRTHWLVGFLLLLALGCGSRKFAPVSGKVTLNGEPLANALVAFNPIPKGGSSEAGPGSIGTTDANGEFTLRVRPDQPGALVGNHRVGITAMVPAAGDTDARQPRRRGSATKPLPRRYNEETTLTFEVPSAGTDQAIFELKSP